jgi:N-acetyl-gamma-glutamyl-phosphate reductase / acetylglutamate kinase
LESIAQPTVFGVSGYSGAGTISSTSPDGEPVTLPKVDPATLEGGLRAYTLTDHIHEREAGVHLSTLLPQVQPVPGKVTRKKEVKIAFTPHVAAFFSAILSTLSFPLTPSPDLKPKLSARDITDIYHEYYRGERLIRIKDDGKVVQLSDVQNKQGAVIGGLQVQSEGRRVVVTVRLNNSSLISAFGLFVD